MTIAVSEATVAARVLQACRLDVLAFKPGNVSIFSSGHGMSAEQFFASAEAVAGEIAKPDLSVGERIFHSVSATWRAVACNTNLGIVLLLAPLVEAVLRGAVGDALRGEVCQVLATLTHHDAQQVYAAIRLASPAGLGHSAEHDVEEEPQATLLTIMQSAAERDRIAYQYSHGYADIFGLGVPALQHYHTCWSTWTDVDAWALVGCYLRFLSTFKDTHIERKFGAVLATEVTKLAKRVETNLESCENPRDAMLAVQAFDEKLKREGLNPGTSADLAVASQLTFHLDDLCADVQPGRTASSPEAAQLSARDMSRKKTKGVVSDVNFQNSCRTTINR